MSAPVTHRLPKSAAGFDDVQFTAFTRLHPDLRIERDATGKLIVMPPTGWNSGKRNANLTMQLAQWAQSNGRGVAVDSSTGFKLPNGAIRSPDAAWVPHERLATLSPAP
ncbi:MAG: Uma2 family endonuclease [Acidobacteriota bacterium]|nr:Uma2 family endonuclease [Acidobacteriota bacterium]